MFLRAVELDLLPEMAADDHGLIHGGFVFGLADYAAMLAINHPNVVLGACEMRFLKPLLVGQTLVAEARLESEQGKKRFVASRRAARSGGDGIALLRLFRHVLHRLR
jgi:acyl-coenzyme A thioesterase PaaI-like protein